MGVRLRIALLFASIVGFILVLVCGSVYFFSYQNRINNITTRLTNRAITTARLLSRSDYFNRKLVQQIDSSTTLALLNKTIQVYDTADICIYAYSDVAGDSLQVDEKTLAKARKDTRLYYTLQEKDVIAYSMQLNHTKLVMVIGAIDYEGKEKLVQLRLIIFLSFTGGLLIAIAGGYFFSRGLLRPIKNIADEVNEISAKNLASRIRLGSVKDEWTYLSSTLNALLNRLQDSFEVQQRFVSHASHELSTPLTSISSQLEVSLLKNRNAGDYRRVMESIYQDVRHLNKLTQTLLEFAHASGSTAGIVIDIVRIDEILMRLPSELTKTNPIYTVILLFHELPQEEDKLLVWGNEELLFSALNNVVSNACKYSPDHKAIVKLQVVNKEIIVSIKDNGPGIPNDGLKNIFQPFFRINSDKQIKGFGLGLSLANQIVKLHKGQIMIDSVLAQGTTVRVSLPIAANATENIGKY